ncbi:MAG: flavin reductase family protein [Clostridia bacterium]|nr:flavin reductase family protein [Clostridia bacterium]
MKEISYLDAIQATTDHLQHGGVFLTAGGDTPNTMTIGWGSVGCIWSRPVFTVLVRPQRHTYEMLKNAGEFTVSVPTKNALKKELAFAGTQSGRDVNKFEGHGITAVPAQEVNAPIVKECGIHFECRTRLVQDMTADQMDPSIIDFTYKAGDFHTMFFGEILRCYTTDED